MATNRDVFTLTGSAMPAPCGVSPRAKRTACFGPGRRFSLTEITDAGP